MAAEKLLSQRTCFAREAPAPEPGRAGPPEFAQYGYSRDGKS
jgi:hypothetical protein